MSLKGDFEALDRLVKNLGELSKKALPEISIKGAIVIGEVIQEQYAQGRAPWGNQWAPLAESTVAKGRTPPPLDDTGNMKRKSKTVPTVKGIRTRIPSPAPFHQSGTSKMPARPLVPYGDMLPPSWAKPLEAVGAQVIKSTLKK